MRDTLKYDGTAGGIARWKPKTKEERSAHMRMMAHARWANVSPEDRAIRTAKATAAMRAARWPKH